MRRRKIDEPDLDEANRGATAFDYVCGEGLLTLNALRQNLHNKVILTNERAARRDCEYGFLPSTGMVL